MKGRDPSVDVPSNPDGAPAPKYARGKRKDGGKTEGGKAARRLDRPGRKRAFGGKLQGLLGGQQHPVNQAGPGIDLAPGQLPGNLTAQDVMAATPRQVGAAIMNHPGIANQVATENPGLTGRYLQNLYNTAGPNAQADMRGIARFGMNNGLPQGYTGVSPMGRYGDQLGRLTADGGAARKLGGRAKPKKPKD